MFRSPVSEGGVGKQLSSEDAMNPTRKTKALLDVVFRLESLRLPSIVDVFSFTGITVYTIPTAFLERTSIYA